jgi:heterodisulfide reductase subunit A-like polyferredoxin
MTPYPLSHPLHKNYSTKYKIVSILYTMKIVIVGGGIAGLSCATLLCQVPGINIELYEKESFIGVEGKLHPIIMGFVI